MMKDLILKSLKKVHFIRCWAMSKNCVDVAIDISNKYDIPLFLIASRRQIDADQFNGGYVNNWSTRTFSEYVKKRDKNKRLFFAEIMEVHGKIQKKLKRN